MSDEYAALRRAAASLRRAAKAAEAIDGDTVAWALVQAAITEAKRELAERAGEDGAYSLPDSLKIDGDPILG